MLDLARQLNDTETPPMAKDAGPPRRSGCCSALALTLAGMCLAQVVLATGLWIRPYMWWELRGYPSPGTDVHIELGQEGLVNYRMVPQPRVPGGELARR